MPDYTQKVVVQGLFRRELLNQEIRACLLTTLDARLYLKHHST